MQAVSACAPLVLQVHSTAASTSLPEETSSSSSTVPSTSPMSRCPNKVFDDTVVGDGWTMVQSTPTSKVFNRMCTIFHHSWINLVGIIRTALKNYHLSQASHSQKTNAVESEAKFRRYLIITISR
uniref:UBP26 n=1 Tax=Arundo donax TaxID=35708 RepID=A0A0A9GCF6_ARUDO